MTQPEWWSAFERFQDGFVEAMDQRYYTLASLKAGLLSGRLLFWPGDNAAIIARIKHYPTGAKSIKGILATGDLKEIAGSLIPQAEAFGRSIGCASAFISSREAWRRILRDDQYDDYQVVVRKEL